ncbi:hypothetical protein BDF19DRAFT_452846 [Syncephalis fuscata]|nr:hypothetical protein BDF19DRAFT_452846 [Syncephalis fuscata]
MRVPIPKGARNGREREYYMNCADVLVRDGENRGSVTGPELLVAQLPGKPQFPEWIYTVSQNDRRHLFAERKIVTIPVGVSPTIAGRVIDEPGGGKLGSMARAPKRIDYKRFENDSYNYFGNG